MVAMPTETEGLQEAEGTLLQSEAIGRLQDILPRYERLVFDAGNCAASALHYLSVPEHGDLHRSRHGWHGLRNPGRHWRQLSGTDVGRTVVLCGDGAF